MKAFNLLATASLVGLLVTGCGGNQAAPASTNAAQTQPASTEQVKPEEKKELTPAEYTQAAKDLIAELEKGKAGGKVDWDKAQKIYGDNLKALVQSRDEENSDQTNDHLETAMNAGKDGSLSALTVAELHEKLLYKVFFQSMRHDFKEANDKFKDKDKATAEITEAKGFYDGLMKDMVGKRDTKYGTQLVSTIDAGFGEMDSALEKGDNLAFNLGKQVVDKTIMKAFYLASGAEKGYGYKLEGLVKEGSKDDLKAEQAEGWAFFQSLKGYLSENDKADVDYINQQFDLSNDVKNIKGDLINKAYVRAFANTAKGEYKETFENWGKDKAAITAMEGALFIDVVKNDLPKALGSEAKAKALIDNAQKLINEVKAGNKDGATAVFKLVEADLDKLTKYGK
ncbi:hypothetical protein ACQCN2_14905 [Brevibacillus ginsengisoli]|uniref:hypothetical protein n=1 Tax=Brevibacillus ginsengisoli TaxID=363854 RepID=UPI003CE6E114